MVITPKAPISSAPITSIVLRTAVYNFLTGTIVIELAEMADDETAIDVQTIELTSEETEKFFSAGPEFRDTFIAAFYGAIAGRYPLG